jgi:ribosomal protein L35AE/L33A
MKSVMEINKAILSGNLSADELRSINQALKAAYTMLQSRAKVAFYVGESVRFNTRSGELVTGKVTKINQKTIAVRTDTGMQWKVSPSLLKKA